jgi:glycosyltransferase involved in cell wall biosynthesis
LAAVGALVELGIPFEYTIVCHNFPEGLPLPEQAKLVSGLSDEKLLREYATADALLLPLSDATANNAILEAMACGLPVFSVDVGGVSEMTATAACLVAPGDSEALGAQLLRAAEQPEWRRELSERGLLRAAELSWGKVADEMVEVYQEAMLLSKARHAAH